MRLPSKTEARSPSGLGARSPAKVAPRLPAQDWVTDQASDPLAALTADPDDVEAVSVEVIDSLKQAYRDSEKQQRDKYAAANSVDYYRVIVFDTPEQACAFNRAIGQKINDRILDGRAVAAALGIEIPKSEWRPKAARPNPRLARLALPMPPRQPGK